MGVCSHLPLGFICISLMPKDAEPFLRCRVVGHVPVQVLPILYWMASLDLQECGTYCDADPLTHLSAFGCLSSDEQGCCCFFFLFFIF